MNNSNYKYTPKCQMTRLSFDNDNSKFETTGENIRRMVDTIFAVNPHYKRQFEGIDDYLPSIEARITFERSLSVKNAERIAIEEIEKVNSHRWTFNNGISYCPYWQMTKDEYTAYSELMYNLFINNR